MSHRTRRALTVALAVALAVPTTTASAHRSTSPQIRVLNHTALDGLGTGSALGPDGAIYVANSIDGTVVRIDTKTGAERVVGSGLPLPNGGFGAWDVAFRGNKLYALVTLAGADIGQDAVMGIYRLGRDGTFSVFADIGAWAASHPPADPDWFLAQGVQYSMDVWRDGFVVADAHHAKVFRIDGHGVVSDLVAFPSTDVVPIGLESANGALYLATAGPIPHLPATSKIERIRRDGSVEVVAGWGPDYSGVSGLIIDVEAGRRGRLFGLLQGYWDLEPVDSNEGFPAAPNTGEIVSVDDSGEFHTVVSGLDQPTSFEVVGRTAFVVTLTGTVLRIDGI
jgi:hypothetical protein